MTRSRRGLGAVSGELERALAAFKTSLVAGCRRLFSGSFPVLNAPELQGSGVFHAAAET